MHNIITKRYARVFTKLQVILLISFHLVGCTTIGSTEDSNLPAPPNTSSSQDEITAANTAFDNFTYSMFIDNIKSNTLNLFYTLYNPTTYGIIPSENITLGHFNTDSTQTHMLLENYAHILSNISYNQLTPSNQLTYDLLLDYITNAKVSASYNLYYEPLTPYTGLQAQLPILLSEFPLRSKEDIFIYLDMLSTIPEYFDSLIGFETAKANNGFFMSNSCLEVVLNDCYAFINMPNNYLISTFNNRISEISTLDKNTQEELYLKNQDIIESIVIPSYETLAEKLGNLRGTCTNELGLCYFKTGRTYYSQLVKEVTGSARSIPEISLLIKDTILNDMIDIQDTISLEHFTDSQLQQLTQSSVLLDFHSSQDILDKLKEHTTSNFPKGAKVSTTIKSVPTDMEPYLSPAFYLLPPIDNFNENTIYINHSRMLDDVTLYTTLAHEGYPGHLYQTTYFSSKSPNPVRNILNYGGYIEGWATYVEMCSYYFGDIPEPQCLILQKNSSIMLGIYAYTDIGIHYDGWTVDDTIDFYHTYGFYNDNAIKEIHQLILSTPGNYLKYYLGYVEFLELKRFCMKEWGDDFSQQRFHKAVLDIGPAPFYILKSYVIK